MVNKELINIIFEKSLKGFKKEKIKEQLLNNGWSPQEIEGAFTQFNKDNLYLNKKWYWWVIAIILGSMPILVILFFFLRYGKDVMENNPNQVNIAVGISLIIVGVIWKKLYSRFTSNK